jgi:hypothetical protein
VNGEELRICKGIVVVYLKVLSLYSPGKSEEKPLPGLFVLWSSLEPRAPDTCRRSLTSQGKMSMPVAGFERSVPVCRLLKSAQLLASDILIYII